MEVVATPKRTHHRNSGRCVGVVCGYISINIKKEVPMIINKLGSHMIKVMCPSFALSLSLYIQKIKCGKPQVCPSEASILTLHALFDSYCGVTFSTQLIVIMIRYHGKMMISC
jgi:hypothetical protein